MPKGRLRKPLPEVYPRCGAKWLWPAALWPLGKMPKPVPEFNRAETPVWGCQMVNSWGPRKALGRNGPKVNN